MRARDQEEIYGHNTGYFTLSEEKENTVTGVLGEMVVQRFISERIGAPPDQSSIELCPLGSQYDLRIQMKDRSRFVHVKSGLWKNWPEQHWHFGIHANQGIQVSGAPVVLVSFLNRPEGFPKTARIEGFVSSDFLKSAPIIDAGTFFPSTRVISRTRNILTRFSDYANIQSLIDAL